MPAKKIKYLIPVPKEKIRNKYKDVFDMKTFYKAIRQWVKEYGWTDEDGKENYETFYGERIGREGAREIWIRWRLQKKPEDTPLVYYLDFYFHNIYLIKTEVIVDGKKIKANKGELDFYFQGFIEETYKKSMAEHSLLKHIVNLFVRRSFRKVVEGKKKALHQEIYILQNFIKNWFQMKRYVPYAEPGEFFPSYAFPSHKKK